ncbi:hypothetical protein ACFQ2Y_47250 [Streptomyces malaysiensis subsp. malaysiensis]
MSTDTRIHHDRVDLADLAAIADHEPVRRRAAGQAVGGGVILVLAGFVVAILVSNPGFDWPTVGRYLFDVSVLKGIAVTLELTIAAMSVGIAGGVVLAVLRQSRGPIPAPRRRSTSGSSAVRRCWSRCSSGGSPRRCSLGSGWASRGAGSW